MSFDNVTGDEALSYGAGTSKSWIFLKRAQRFLFDKEGVVEVGDAYIMLPPADSVNVRDQVVVDGETYEITATGSIMIRHVGGTLYTYAVLHKLLGAQT